MSVCGSCGGKGHLDTPVYVTRRFADGSIMAPTLTNVDQEICGKCDGTGETCDRRFLNFELYTQHVQDLAASTSELGKVLVDLQAQGTTRYEISGTMTTTYWNQLVTDWMSATGKKKHYLIREMRRRS